MKMHGFGSKDRKEYADVMNRACADDGNELRSTGDAARKLKELLGALIKAGSEWAPYEKDFAEDLGYRQEIKTWQNKMNKHRSHTGRLTPIKGEPEIRTRSNVARVLRRMTGVQETLIEHKTAQPWEDSTAADLAAMIQRAESQVGSEQQTIRDCTRLLALMHQTGTTVVRDALNFIGKTLTEFLVESQSGAA